MQSLSGHTSPVESVAFDSSEVLVVAGASSGVIKLWDLEETKSKLICLFVLQASCNFEFVHLTLTVLIKR